MSFFGRLGSEEVKFLVIVTVLRVETTSSTEPMAVRLTRGSRSAVTEPAVGRSGGYDFRQQSLQVYATLYRKRDRFLPKDADLLVLTLKGVERPFGRAHLDLSTLVDERGERERSQLETLALDRCADKRARLAVRITTKPMKGGAGGDEEGSVKVGGVGGGAVSVSRADEADEAHNLDDFIGQEGAEEEEGEEEEEEPQPQRKRPAAAAAAQPAPARRPVEQPQRVQVRGAAAQRGRGALPAPQAQRGRRTVAQEEEEETHEEEEEADEEQQEEEAEEEVEEVEEEAQQPAVRNGSRRPAEQETIHVRTRPGPAGGQPRLYPAVITSVRPMPTEPQRNGRAPPRGRPQQRALQDEEEEEQEAEEHEEGEEEQAEEHGEEDANGAPHESKEVEESEELVEDEEEEEEEEEEDADHVRTVKFGGVDARSSNTKTRSPHTDVHPGKSNLKAAVVPTQATTKRDNIIITNAGAVPMASVSSSSSSSSVSSAVTATPPPAGRRSSTSSPTATPSAPSSPKHAIAVELRGVKPISPSQIFSCTLPEAMTLNPRTSPLDVPFIFDVLCTACERHNGLFTEGIFRVTADRRAVDELKAQLLEGQYKLQTVDVHAVANVLKQWLMAVGSKQPIIPVTLHAQCLDIGKIDPDHKEELEQGGGSDSDGGEDAAVIRRPSRVREPLQRVVSGLPLLSKRLLVRLIALLLKTANPPYSARNKMNVHALAVVFAPSVLSLQQEAGVDGFEMFQRAKWAVRFVEHLIHHNDLLERDTAIEHMQQQQPHPGTLEEQHITSIGPMVPVPVPAAAAAASAPVLVKKSSLAEASSGSGGGVVMTSAAAVRAAAATNGAPVAPSPKRGGAGPSPRAAASSNGVGGDAAASSARAMPGAVATPFAAALQQQKGERVQAAAPSGGASAMDRALQLANASPRRQQRDEEQRRVNASQDPRNARLHVHQQPEEEEEEEEDDAAENEHEEDAGEEEAEEEVEEDKEEERAHPPRAGDRRVILGRDGRPVPVTAVIAPSSRGPPSRPSQPQQGPIKRRPAPPEEEEEVEEDDEVHEDDGEEPAEDHDEEHAEEVEVEEEEDEDEKQPPPSHHKRLPPPPLPPSGRLPPPTAASAARLPPPPPPSASARPPQPASASSPASALISTAVAALPAKPAAARPPPPSAASARPLPPPANTGKKSHAPSIFGDESEEEEEAREEDEEDAGEEDGKAPQQRSAQLPLTAQPSMSRPAPPSAAPPPRRPSPLPVSDDDEATLLPTIHDEPAHPSPQPSQPSSQRPPLLSTQSLFQPPSPPTQSTPPTLLKADTLLPATKKPSDSAATAASEREQERAREIERLKLVKEAAALRAELETARKLLEGANGMLDRRTAEVIELKKKVAGGSGAGGSEEAVVVVAEKLKERDRQLAELTTKLTAAAAEVKAAQQQSAVQKQKDEADKQALQGELTAQAQRIAELEQQLEEQHAQAEQAARDIAQLRPELSAKQAEVARLTAALSAAEASASRVVVSMGKEEEEKEESDSEYEVYDDDTEETAELKQRLIDLKRRMKKKNEELKRAKRNATTATLHTQSSPASTPSSTTSSQASSPRPDNSEYQRLLRSNDAKMSAQQAELDQHRLQLLKASEDAKAQRAALSDLQEDVRRKDLHISELVQQLKQSAAAPPPPPPDAASASSAKAARAEVARLSAERDALSEQLLALQQQVEARDVQIEEYEKRLTELQASLDEMEKDGARMTKLNQAIQEQLSKLRETTVATAGGGGGDTELQQRLDEATQEKEQLQSRLQQLEDELRSVRDDLNKATKELDKAKSLVSSPLGASAAISSVSAHRELLKTKEALEALKARWESVRLDQQAKLEAERAQRRLAQEQLAVVQQENDLLRQRHIGLEEVREKELTTLAIAAAKKRPNDRTTTQLTSALQAAVERSKYLERQVREGEGMLARARASWAETSAVIGEEVGRLEAELGQAREALAAAMDGKGVEVSQLELLSKRLMKNERLRVQMKHAMGEMEDEVNKWKAKLADAVKEKEALLSDNELLREDVVKHGIALKEIAQVNFEMKEWIRDQHKGKK